MTQLRCPALVRLASAAGLACLVAGPLAPAHAQPAPARDPVGAEVLFKRGVKALAADDWSSACEDFRKSMALDPSPSTLAKIARCREHDGQLATAWYEYQRALKLLRDMDYSPRRRKELEEFIGGLAAALEPRVPKLRVSVTPVPEGLELLRDGEVVATAALGEPLPVDPGEHELVARAPGYLEQKRRLTVVEGALTEAKLELERAPAPEPPAVSTAPPPRAAASARPAPAATPERSEAPPSVPSSGSRRPAGLVVGAAGLVTLGAAGFFGLRTLSLVEDSESHCSQQGSRRECDPRGLRLLHQATDAQTNGLILAAVGAVALGGGLALYLTAPRQGRSTSLVLGPRGLVVGGAF